MRIAKNLLELIGQTPMVQLNKINDTDVKILVKLEYLNPVGSVKDRVGLCMIEEAERQGRLKPGMTIVEPTSGNTGMGLALAALLKGYRLVCTMPDKVSPDKVLLLEAFGAECVVCPTAVEPDDARSYYSAARRIVKERNGYMPNQYENPSNPLAHYRTTGPEIWSQTQGKLDAFVCGVGTGGTISGIGRYLKEQNPKVKVVGVDPEGSMIYTEFYKKPHNVHTYAIEGIGEDLIPGALDLHVMDEVVRVHDRESYLFCRQLLKAEGLFLGSSGGAAVLGALRYARTMQRGTMVVLVPDSGRNYLTRVYNDEWMREKGFVE